MNNANVLGASSELKNASHRKKGKVWWEEEKPQTYCGLI